MTVNEDEEFIRDSAQDERINLLEKRIAKLETIVDRMLKKSNEPLPETVNIDLQRQVEKLYQWIKDGQRWV